MVIFASNEIYQTIQMRKNYPNRQQRENFRFSSHYKLKSKSRKRKPKIYAPQTYKKIKEHFSSQLIF